MIEFNARLGDPEAINLLAILKTDFVDVCRHMITGTLRKLPLQFKQQATVVKYVVPNGYPNDSVKAPIQINATSDQYYYGAVTKIDNQLMMTGSRAIAVLGQANQLADAEKSAQQLAAQIKGPVFYRKDIGTSTLIDRYVRLLYV